MSLKETACATDWVNTFNRGSSSGSIEVRSFNHGTVITYLEVYIFILVLLDFRVTGALGSIKLYFSLFLRICLFELVQNFV